MSGFELVRKNGFDVIQESVGFLVEYRLKSGDDKSMRGMSNCHTLHEKSSSARETMLITAWLCSLTGYTANGECMIRWPALKRGTLCALQLQTLPSFLVE